MTIEIHEPRLETLIQQRMASGLFQSVEELLLTTLESKSENQAERGSPKQNLDEFLRASPLWNSEIEFKREKEFPRPVEL